jgi:C1A family cysteine protease
MKRVVGLLLLSLLVVFVQAQESEILSQEIVNIVNGANAGWTAGFPERFTGVSKSQVQKLLGFKPNHEFRAKLTAFNGNLRVTADNLKYRKDLPEQFDWRQQNPACVGAIQDQGSCGKFFFSLFCF